MKIKFTKMQGCGNDYVYINGISEDVPVQGRDEIVRKLSDRHFGIGSDGVIFINASDIADFEMEMWNADGTRSEMCGNGIRCVAKYVYDYGLTDKEELDICSMGAVKHILLNVKDDKVDTVQVDMGEPILDSKLIPVLCNSPEMLMCPVETSRGVFPLTSISMGNPHTVIFCNDVDAIDVHGIGAEIENSPLFPDKVNVEFVKIISPVEIEMRVWERGSGETLACGTGACASVVAGVITGKTSRKVLVHLKGGDLHVDWESTNNHVYLSGHGVSVFEGIYLI